MTFRKFGTPEPITPVTTEGPDDQGIEVTGALHESAPFDPRDVLTEGEESGCSTTPPSSDRA